MKIYIKSFLIGVFSTLMFVILSGQTYYNNYDVNSIMKKLKDLDIISSEINEIKAQINYGVNVKGGYIDQVLMPVNVDGGYVDKINNSVDCICYEIKK